MRNFLFAVLISISIGCASLPGLLPIIQEILVGIEDGSQILSAIESFEKMYFLAHPNPDLQGKIEAKIAEARTGLDLALRTAHGASSLDQKQVDAAFADFTQAYKDLLTLVEPIGVHSGTALRAAPHELTVPEPMALHLKVAK